MTSLDRFLMAINHQEPDRVPIFDMVWPSTIERWHKEGLPENVSAIDITSREAVTMPGRGTSLSAGDYFGYEMIKIRPDVSPRFPTEIIEEAGNSVLERTPYGSVRRQVRSLASIPEIVEWSIKSRDDWERIKPRLQQDPARVNWDATRALYEGARAQGKFVAFASAIGWAHFQEYFRTDELLMLMAMDPDWATEMFQVQAELVIGMAQIMLDGGIHFDGCYFQCDLGYRNGLFFSPEMYRTLQLPIHKKVFRFFRDKGKPVILHSDGRVKALIPQFLEAGVSVLNPIETKAGMDLTELKREYGKDLAFMGGIDVRAMADPNPQVIEDEIKRKFEVAMVGGGYIYHSDHSIPDNISLAQYRHVLELVRQYGVYR